jgi:hypothetical protein
MKDDDLVVTPDGLATFPKKKDKESQDSDSTGKAKDATQ